MSLLGLVRHLAEIEQLTFRRLLAGEDVPRLYTSHPSTATAISTVPWADPEVVSAAWAAWHAEVDFAHGVRRADTPTLDLVVDDPSQRARQRGWARDVAPARCSSG